MRFSLVFASVVFVAASASAQDFALQVGPPIAGISQNAKKSIFVVRPAGCPNPADATINATAEGVVNGERRTLPLTLTSLQTPGVHAVPDLPQGGVWIVHVSGTCAGKMAGAIVSLGSGRTYRREAVQLLAHHATPAEINASLKALTTGGQK